MQTDDMGAPALGKGDSVAGPPLSGGAGVKTVIVCGSGRHCKVLCSILDRDYWGFYTMAGRVRSSSTGRLWRMNFRKIEARAP
jgi:hypothetical protein